MDLTIRVNRLLAEFANRSGLPALSLDADGVATLLFDEQLHVTLVLLGGRLEPYGGHHLINGPAAEIHNGISHLLQPAFAHILVGKHNVALSLMVYD